MNPLWTIYSNLLIQQRAKLSTLSAKYIVDEQDSVPVLEYHKHFEANINVKNYITVV